MRGCLGRTNLPEDGNGKEALWRALPTGQVSAPRGWLRFALQASGKVGLQGLKSECEVRGGRCIVPPRTWDLVVDYLVSNPSFMILGMLLNFCKLRFPPT